MSPSADLRLSRPTPCLPDATDSEKLRIDRITPIRRFADRDAIDHFEIQLSPTAQLVYVSETTLLSYRRCQQEILRQSGSWYECVPAEERGGASAWRSFVRDHLAEPERIPFHVMNQAGNYIQVDMRKWRAGEYEDPWYRERAS